LLEWGLATVASGRDGSKRDNGLKRTGTAFEVDWDSICSIPGQCMNESETP
jgi:hypothetical protein